jgi:hypothetical protein
MILEAINSIPVDAGY